MVLLQAGPPEIIKAPSTAYYAAAHGVNCVLRFLIKAGVNVDTPFDPETGQAIRPIDIARHRKMESTVAILEAAGVDASSQEPAAGRKTQ